MAITTINPETKDPRPDTLESLGPEAVAYMATEGYAVIDTPQAGTEAAELVSKLESRLFIETGVQDDLVEDRKRYALTTLNIPPLLASLQSQIVGSMRDGSAGHGKLNKLWRRDDQKGVQAFITEVFQYKDDTSFAIHTDDPDAGFPTQVLTTLQGQATFEIYAAKNDTKPKATIPLRPGTKILLRGDDMPGGQLPHSVKDNRGERILMCMYPDRDFDIRVDRAIGFAERDKRMEEMDKRHRHLGVRAVRALLRR